MKKSIFVLVVLALLIAACAPAPANPCPTAAPAESTPPPATPKTPQELLDAGRNWGTAPVYPVISQRVKDIYNYGQTKGIIPYTFSVVGDKQADPHYFMGIYGQDNSPFTAEADIELYQTVMKFHDSFNHHSMTVAEGMTPSNALNQTWVRSASCDVGETPVDCELRLNKPMVTLITLGFGSPKDTNSVQFEKDLRTIVDKIIAAGSIPVIINKNDNKEGDHSINMAMAMVAYDNDIPYLNLWLELDNIPNRGLDVSLDGKMMSGEGWLVRNLMTLRFLNRLWRNVAP